MAVSNTLQERNRLTDELQENPYSIPIYLQRCKIYDQLGFPDLAAMDAYKALLLVDEVTGEFEEYHEEAIETARRDVASLPCISRTSQHGKLTAKLHSTSLNGHINGTKPTDPPKDDQQDMEPSEAIDEAAQKWAEDVWAQDARVQLAHHLSSIGCLRAAYDFIQHALRNDPDYAPALLERARLIEKARAHLSTNNATFDETNINVLDLPDRGLVRREVYPWNHHEEDRTTPEAIELMNRQMEFVAPKLEVRVVELPLLHSDIRPAGEAKQTIKQLGVFAKEHLQPGEEILHERSLLTANNRLHEPLCDACNSALPDITGQINGSRLPKNTQRNIASEPIPCEDCDDIFFCSQECHNLAQESYHPAVCGLDIESISREVPAAEAADALYTLLLLRALAMAQTQETHPLDLKETKYIWGDFTHAPEASAVQYSTTCSELATAAHTNENHNSDDDFNGALRTLPFTFSANILLPLHLLEKLDIAPFTAPYGLAETWVYNTLFAKFRGTASARLNPRDGRPEVAAVHPFWCLANHSCDPNVRWELQGDIQFTVRDRRGAWKVEKGDGVVVEGRPERAGGIEKDEEILNHYVDVDLPVQERREWGAGALGGFCMCERCLWEASQARV